MLHGQLLEAMVERPPPRPLVDDFGIEFAVNAANGSILEQEPPPPSPSMDSPTESTKPPPRPYVSRSRSSSSLMGIISPTIGSPSEQQADSPLTPSPSSATFSPRSPLSPTSPSSLGTSGRPLYLPRSRSSSNETR